MADEEERKRLLEEGRRRFARMKEKRAATGGEIHASPAGVGIVPPPVIKATDGPTLVPTVLFPPAPSPAPPTSTFTPPVVTPSIISSIPTSLPTPIGPTTISPPPSSATTELATKLRMLEKANQVLLDQKAKLEESLHQREMDLAKLKLDLDQERTRSALKNEELLNHVSQLTQQRTELESKLGEALKSQQTQKQQEGALVQQLQDHVKAAQTAAEEQRSKMQQQIDLLQKQVQEAQSAASNAIAKAQQDQASTKQQAQAQQNEAISQLQQQLRIAETAVHDKERLFEETLKQERLRAAQTVAQVNGRCELLQKQVEELQTRLNFEKMQNSTKTTSGSGSDSAEVATLKTLLEDSERKLSHANDLVKERDSRIAKLADELKSALQKQFPQSPQPQRQPAEKMSSPAAPVAAKSDGPITISTVGAEHRKQTEMLMSALEMMQQNRTLLAKELGREMSRCFALTTQVNELGTTLRIYHDKLTSAGISVGPLPSLVPVSVPSVTAESSSSDPPVESPAAAVSSTPAGPQMPPSEPLTPTKSVSSSTVAAESPERETSAISRLPPPSATKPQISEDQEDDNSPSAGGAQPQQTPQQRGSWFGRLWGSAPKPPPKQSSGQVVI